MRINEKEIESIDQDSKNEDSRSEVKRGKSKKSHQLSQSSVKFTLEKPRKYL